MNKAYIEICYTYENHSSFLPPIAIVEVEAEDGELIKNLFTDVTAATHTM